MNPDNSKNRMTVNALLTSNMVVSMLVPIIVLGVLGALGALGTFGIPPESRLTFILCVGASALVIIIIVLFASNQFQRQIMERISSLVDVCRDYTGGDRSVRAVVNGNDEFALLASSLNTVLDNQGVAANTSLGSPGGDAAALQAQIEKLLQEVSAVGDGDLRVQAEVTPDTLGVLADSFNYMIEELAKVVGRVQSTAVQVTNATRRILDRSAELAQATEAQVKQIAQTTEAVEALAVFIQNVARNAQMSVEAAQDALRNAATGQQAVRQTIEGMMLIRENVQETSKKIKRLGERSNEIGEIVRIIEDIADQTNLLALNAAIQSAMAGEHGRGFAVVADEIRLLAERSTESTKKIATLIKSIQGDTFEAVVAMEDSTQEVVKGSQLADDAGRSLNSIYVAVERQAQMIESIARAANEQTPVSEAVAVAMSRISEITRQTDAGTQEAAVSVSYLAELSEQLRASVSTFRLPDRANDMFGSLAPVGSISNVSELGQSFSASMGSGVDHGWGQGFATGFPPLPEPTTTNSGPLISTAARNNQYGFPNNGQQDSMKQASFPGMTNSFANALPNNGQVAFGTNSQSQQAFGNFGGFGNQGNSQPFGNQQDFVDLNAFDSQPPLNGQQSFNSNAFGGALNPGFPPQSPFYQQPNSNLTAQPVQSPNSGLLPPAAGGTQSQLLTARQRWQNAVQQSAAQQREQNQ